jgi:hypothetical protein
MKTQTYESADGSGVQKRPGWRRFPQPAKSSPVSYNKTWKNENRGRYKYAHTEASGGTLLYRYEDGPGPASFAANAEIPGLLSEAGYASKVKLFNQLKGEGANLANMLGERKQVAKSIENVLNILRYTVVDLRRGNIVSAIRRMGGDPLTARKLRGKDIADQWLSLQYGWKPLLSDVYDVVNGLHKREKYQPKIFRCSSKKDAVAPSDSSWAFGPGPKFVGTKNYGRRSTTAIQKYMLRVFPNASLAEPAALGFTNPLVVAWEVTPWSFVVDWFLPVGRYLEQLTADHGWIFSDGCVSTLVKANELAEYTVSEAHTSAGWSYTTTQSMTGAVVKYVSFWRTTLGGFPVPDVPQFKNPFSVAHVENALALLSQAFGRK